MKYTVHIGNRPIVLEHDDLDSNINVDDLTKIDTSNIYGEAVTISPATNRIGMLKSEVEARMSDTKLELRVFEADFKGKLRKAAANDSGFYTIRIGNDDVRIKLTEKALESVCDNNSDWIKIKRKFIQDEKNFNILTSLYWAVQDKSRKLNNLISRTTPEEFIEGMIEEKINGILIKKK